MKKPLILILSSLLILFICLFLGTINTVKCEAEKAIYWEYLGREIGIDFVQNNNGLVDVNKLDSRFLRVSKKMGYSLIVRQGHKIKTEDHGDMPWGFYIQTRPYDLLYLRSRNYIVLAVRDDLSVYEIQLLDMVKYVNEWNR